MATDGQSRGGRVVRFALGLALALTCLRVWVGPAGWESRALAQIPNAGSQRADLLEEVRRTNRLLEDVLTLLRTKSIKVEVQGEAGTNVKGVRPAPGAAPQQP